MDELKKIFFSPISQFGAKIIKNKCSGNQWAVKHAISSGLMSCSASNTQYCKTLKIPNFGTGQLQTIVIFKLLLKSSFARSYIAICVIYKV